jgi:hypothetical protein
MTKVCSVCASQKALSEFYKRKDSPDGLRNDCKDCVRERTKSNYFANHEQQKEWHRQNYRNKLEQNPNFLAEYYAQNREKILAHCAKAYVANRDKRLQQVKEWALNNRGKANANKKAYKASKTRACPAWLTEDDHWLMQEAYELAQLRTKMFGFPWHVDHIVPLRGKDVSGLHVPWNLQVIPGSENITKSNKFLG